MIATDSSFGNDRPRGIIDTGMAGATGSDLESIKTALDEATGEDLSIVVVSDAAGRIREAAVAMGSSVARVLDAITAALKPFSKAAEDTAEKLREIGEQLAKLIIYKRAECCEHAAECRACWLPFWLPVIEPERNTIFALVVLLYRNGINMRRRPPPDAAFLVFDDAGTMNVKEIQKRIAGYYWTQGSCLMPNVKLGQFERDLIRVTRAGYVVEFEIKLSRSDYLADFRKKFWGSRSTKHEELASGDYTHRQSWRRFQPKQFYFVCPKIVEPDEIPEHAGLIFATPHKHGIDVTVMREAPKLPNCSKLEVADMFVLLSKAVERWGEL